jgi:hypothetical protein
MIVKQEQGGVYYSTGGASFAEEDGDLLGDQLYNSDRAFGGPLENAIEGLTMRSSGHVWANTIP